MSAGFEASFATALLAPELPVPEGVVAHTPAIPVARFAVYRNNVAVSLVSAVESRFPAVRALVGEEFFRGMARVFVAAHPPRSPILMFYGDDFPRFIAQFPPAAELEYLADVARLEAARTHAYHAADAASADAATLARVDPARLGTARVLLHPSVRVVRSAHPVVTIWAMNAGEAALAAIEDWRGEDALVARPQFDVEVRRLPPGGAAFVLALAAGEPLAAAVEAARADSAGFDLTSNLAGLIGSGLVTGIVLPEPSKERHP